MTYPLVRDLAAEKIPVRLTCGVLGFSPQAYYAWLKEPIGQRELEDAYLTNALVDAHGDDPEFGYRFLADELEHAGMSAGERRVWRLCSQQKLWSTTVRKGRRSSGKRPGPAVHDDHLQRDFTATEPNHKWVTDITEHPPPRAGLLLRDQGPVLQPNRRLRDRRANDRRPGGHGAEGRSRPPATTRPWSRSGRCCRRTS